MLTLSLEKLIFVTEASTHRNYSNREIKGVSSDTRSLEQGNLFIALKGEKMDGHRFVTKAVELGASAILASDPRVEQSLPDDFPFLLVEDTLLALGKIGQFYREQMPAFRIAITGSLGKTTSKEITAHLLSAQYQTLKSEKSFNNFIGVPWTILKLEAKHEMAVFEMGTNAFGEIRYLSRLIQPEVAVLTCVAESHLEGFGDLDGVSQAKAEVIEGIAPGGLFITNADDPRCREIAQKFSGRVKTFGIKKKADYQATDIKYREEKLHFKLAEKSWVAPILGRHNLYNVLVAMVIALEHGVSIEKIQKQLLTLSLPPMRMEVKQLGAVSILNDAYNANPQSMISALDTLEEYSGKRKLAILGAMLELGENSKELHEKVGKVAAQKSLDALWVVGSQAYGIASGALNAGMPLSKVRCFPGKHKVLSSLQDFLSPEDVVLLKASRGIELETIISEIKEELENEIDVPFLSKGYQST